jgi:hypothetical protein
VATDATLPFHVLVRSDEIDETPRRDDKGVETPRRRQTVFVNIGHEFPVPQQLTLKPGQAAYPPGMYIPSAESFRQGDYGRVTISSIKGLISFASLAATRAPTPPPAPTFKPNA